MMDEGETTLYVDMEHLKHYDGTLSDGIQRDFYQLEPHLRRGLRDVVEEMDASYLHTEAGVEKELFVCFYNVDTVSGMRELKADTIGRLCAFRGTVTRTSDVRPELFVGCFRCLDCQTGAALTRRCGPTAGRGTLACTCSAVLSRSHQARPPAVLPDLPLGVLKHGVHQPHQVAVAAGPGHVCRLAEGARPGVARRGAPGVAAPHPRRHPPQRLGGEGPRGRQVPLHGHAARGAGH